MEKILLFQVGTRPFGIDLALVKSIESVKHIVDDGTQDSSRLNRVFDDKQTAPYDLVSVFEKKTACRDFENEKLIVVEADGQSMGMIVSRVDQVVSVGNDRIEPLSPAFKGASMSCFPKVLKHEDALILLLAPEGIEKIVQETANVQNVTDMSDCKDARPDAKEIITPINELSTGEIIDAVDIDDESQCESTSFLANLLQTNRDASTQGE